MKYVRKRRSTCKIFLFELSLDAELNLLPPTPALTLLLSASGFPLSCFTLSFTVAALRLLEEYWAGIL